MQWHQKRDAAQAPKTHVGIDWAQHPDTQRVYMSTASRQADGVWTHQTTQTLDRWGNVTAVNHYSHAGGRGRWRAPTATPISAVGSTACGTSATAW